MLKVAMSMLSVPSTQSGLIRFDGSSLVADINKNELIKGAYINKVQYNEQETTLIVTMSDGTNFSISNFIAIDTLSAEAIKKRGANGINGSNGKNGLNGKAGIEGARGEKGPNGNIGLKGQIGILGPNGDRGPDGVSGIVGVKGYSGPRGERGLSGIRGPMGENGVDGMSNIVLSSAAPDVTPYKEKQMTVLWIEA